MRESFTVNTHVWFETKIDIEMKIIKGVYEENSRFPSLQELTEIYGIGKSTAQKVSTALYEEKILEKQRGIGFFVKENTRKKLYEKHHINLEKKVQEVVDYAYKMGIHENELEEMVAKIINEYDKKEVIK